MGRGFYRIRRVDRGVLDGCAGYLDLRHLCHHTFMPLCMCCALLLLELTQSCRAVPPPRPPRYVESFRPDLMEVVAAWLRGVRFADLVKMTKVFEVGAYGLTPGEGGGGMAVHARQLTDAFP